MEFPELSRYDIIDAYTLEELQREYRSSDVKGRIRLLEGYYSRNKAAPYEIAILAVEDSNVEVRQWTARNGKYLDYRESSYKEGQFEYEYPERNLEDRLKNDPDPFVRACLRENPEVFHPVLFITNWKEWFLEATHLERLALVRNPKVSLDMMERILDHEDEELGISLEERKELVLAFLTSSKNQDKRGLDPSEFVDGYKYYLTQKSFTQMWKLISKWPGETNVHYPVYRYLNADDSIKAEIYKACDEPFLRSAILENCDPDDFATIKLGMKDSDDICRGTAYSKARYPKSEVIEELLQGKDTAALGGLACNQTLSLDNLEKVRSRLRELDDDVGVIQADSTIEQVMKKRAPKDPERLFDYYEGREGDFLEDKIDFIGNWLLSFEDKIEDKISERMHEIAQQAQPVARQGRSLLLWIAIAIGVALLVLIFK